MILIKKKTPLVAHLDGLVSILNQGKNQGKSGKNQGIRN